MTLPFGFLRHGRSRLRATLRARGRALPRAGALAAGLLLLALTRSAPSEAQSPAGTVALLAAGDLRGEIKPCGCSPEGQLGGLPRRLTFLEQAFAAKTAPKPILVDLGNNFPEPSEQGKLKIELIQTLLKQFPPAAILPGPNELAMGLSTLDPALPYLVSNDAVGKAFLPSVTEERGGVKIGIYGYLSPKGIYQEFADQYRLLPVNAEWLATLRERIRAAGQTRAILLFRGEDAELRAFLEAKLFDRIVVGNPYADELNPVVKREVAGAVLPQVPTKGQGLYRLPLPLDGARALPAAAPAPLPEPVWLSDRYADHPAAVHAFAIYDDKVKGLFFARLQTMEKNQAQSPYAGAETCAACHVKATAAWKASRHSHALATLERVGKQFDPECLACHVVGLGEQGFLSKELTPGLANVQCENCHGPGKAHVADPKGVKLGRIATAVAGHGSAESVCRTCHHGSHSPKFSFPAYWPKVAHGLD